MKSKTKKEFSPEEQQQVQNLKVWMENHGRPMTRRQLLASGAKLGAAGLFLSPLQVLTNSFAHAQNCAAAGDLPAFMNITLAGGASLTGNIVIRDEGGQYMDHYGAVGLGSAGPLSSGQVHLFGKQSMSFAPGAGILTGIMNTTTAAIQDKTSMFVIAVESNDDTTNNEIDATPLIARAKANSSAFLPPLGRNRNRPALIPAVPALDVRSVADIENAIGVQGSVASLTSDQKSKIFTSIERLTASQAAALTAPTATPMTGASLLGQLVQSATGLNTNLISTPSAGLNPANATGFANIWDLANGTQSRDAAVVLNALNGNAVAGYIEMGGYDYHGQGRANQITKDTDAGTKVGQVLASAAALGKKIFLTLTTDGSVGHAISDTLGSPPTGDRGQNGLIICFLYDPAARPSLNGIQVGNYRNGGNNSIGVDTTTLVGGSPANATAAVVANYLTFAGKGTAGIETVAPRVFPVEQLDKIVKVVG